MYLKTNAMKSLSHPIYISFRNTIMVRKLICLILLGLLNFASVNLFAQDYRNDPRNYYANNNIINKPSLTPFGYNKKPIGNNHYFYNNYFSGATCYSGTVNREASGYHSNLYITSNPNYPTSGTQNLLYAWGQDACTFTGTATSSGYSNGSAYDLCVPTIITGYSGIPLEVRGASTGSGGHDFYVLRTSTNLYLFGDADYSTVTKGGLGNGVLTNSAASIATSSSYSNLPVAFSEIASMQIQDGMLAIVTKTNGNVWINGTLGTKTGSSYYGPQYGDGGASTNIGDANGWHEVMLNSSTALSNITNLSLAYGKASAVSSTGSVYFWELPYLLVEP